MGFFIVKSNNRSKNILSKSLNSDSKECKEYDEWPAEQGCMIKMYKDNIKNNGIILPIGTLQSWHKSNNEIKEVYDNSLILHLAGVNNEKRYEIFKNLKENDYKDYFNLY